MNRETRIWLLCHLYPVYLVCHMQFADWCDICTAIFNIMPILFVSLIINTWIKSSHIRLCHNEKLSLYLFIYFFVIVHIYYAACALIGQSLKGKIWIIHNNAYFVYFCIFICIFYFIARAKQRWNQ